MLKNSAEVDKIKEEVKNRAKVVNTIINSYLELKDPKVLYRAVRHLIDAGGKRLRPVLCLISAEAIKEDWNRILPAAAAIEIIHNFTLIHDDIMDKDLMRRGVPTVHTAFDESTAILAGDTLFAKAFEIIIDCDVNPKYLTKAIKMLADVCIRICEGQYLDISFEKRKYITEKEYFEMIEKKTAHLIAASCALPAVLFGKSDKLVNALWNFGLFSGIGFQIHDDILDLIGRDKIGKDWGSDIVEGKKTLIMIKAQDMGVEIDIFGKKRATEKEIENAVKKLLECGAIDYARNKAKEFIEKAKKELKILEESKAKTLLTQIAEYLVTREY
ncbi:polyprenyl synthetase family protein [Candidatus Bathyarchaeota archaeon]|nr:MAG: polyprenyl synthetase family protein [Candidatus Bathyarchaeota archaeon]